MSLHESHNLQSDSSCVPQITQLSTTVIISIVATMITIVNGSWMSLVQVSFSFWSNQPRPVERRVSVCEWICMKSGQGRRTLEIKAWISCKVTKTIGVNSIVFSIIDLVDVHLPTLA